MIFPTSEDYIEFYENEENQVTMIEAYGQTLDYEDLPESVKLEIKTDEVSEWDAALKRYVMQLEFKDVPDEYVHTFYEQYCEDK